MAKFLVTSGITSELEDLITKAEVKLVLISPYLKISQLIKERIAYRDRNNLPTMIVYGKEDLHSNEKSFFNELNNITLKYYQNLHAKCYLNEKKIIITSLNLHDYSVQNNREMGVLIEKSVDAELFTDALKEAEFIIANSKTIKEPRSLSSVANHHSKAKTIVKSNIGYCIRTGIQIPFNIEKPMSPEAFKKWAEYEDEEYGEKYCHFSGEKSFGQTCMRRPILPKNYKKATELGLL